MTVGTQSDLSAPAGYSSSDLVFNDDFSGTSLNNWKTYITSNAAKGAAWNSNGSGGSNEGAQYAADYDLPSNVSVNNGLTLTTTKQTQTVNGTTYPYTGGAVSSYGKFEFTGGYLQISAESSGGSGAWPALWLLPGQGAGNSGDNFEIDMQEGGMTTAANPNNYFTYHLHNSSGQFGGSVNTGEDLTTGYHTYGIDWEPGKSITYYLDGKAIGEITSAQTTIPSEPMEVIMNNSMANSNASGWHTSVNSSTPSTTQMKIADVQLYQKAGSGETVTGKNVTAGSGTTSSGGTTTGAASGSTSSGSSTSAGTPSGGTTTTTGTGSTGTASAGTGGFSAPSGPSSGSTASGSGTTTTTGSGSSSAGTTGTGTGTTSGGGSVTDPTGANSGTTSSGGTSVSTGSSGTTTPKAPSLTVADPALSVSPGRHNGIDLGVSVTVPKAGDNVTVNIKGLPGYETITDKLDHKTFSGSNITLTAAEANSGLTLTSSYRGTGHPTATLTVTATDHTANSSSAAQSIVVKDPPATSVTTTPSGSSGTSGASSSSHGGWSALQADVSHWFDSHPGFAKMAKTLGDAVTSKSQSAISAGGWSTDSAASAGDKAYALLNQMMASDFGKGSHFAQGGSPSAQSQQQTSSLLTRPLH